MNNKILNEDFKRLASTLVLVIAIMAILVVTNNKTGFLNQAQDLLVKPDETPLVEEETIIEEPSE